MTLQRCPDRSGQSSAHDVATEERQSEGRVCLGDINYTAYNRAANVDSFGIEVFPAQSRNSNISSMGDLKL
jgi:hypothetical protein